MQRQWGFNDYRQRSTSVQGRGLGFRHACAKFTTGVAEIGVGDGPARIEVITTEQIDAHARNSRSLIAIGLWQLRAQRDAVPEGSGLAYEIVINSKPLRRLFAGREQRGRLLCRACSTPGFRPQPLLQELTMFKQWDARHAASYLAFIAACEEKWGAAELQRCRRRARASTLRASTAIPASATCPRKRNAERREHGERLFNDLRGSEGVGQEGEAAF